MTEPELRYELDSVRAYQRRIAAEIEAKNQEIDRLVAQYGMAEQREGELMAALEQMVPPRKLIGTIMR